MEVMAKFRDTEVPFQLDKVDAARLPGKITIGSHGYGQVWSPVSRCVLLHRWILGLATGDTRIGDHINGDRFDCRRENLRAVSPSASSSNRKASGRSGFRGVYQARSGRWLARGCPPHRGRAVHLGTFDTIAEAAIVAQAWRIENLPGYVDR